MDMENRLTIDRLNEQGCLNMLQWVLKHMSRDFRRSYKEYLADPTDIDAYDQYRQVREEFTSDYFKNLTRLDGNWVVKKLEATVRQEVGQCA